MGIWGDGEMGRWGDLYICTIKCISYEYSQTTINRSLAIILQSFDK
ncbi:MAG: hypothetical protein SWX82_23295 [Cyanobacteriota bacterium]|nr:hypothetical protein [Cyanobacteriota bacterium]